MSRVATTSLEQLALLAEGLRQAAARVNELERRLPEESWRATPGPGRWSAAECVEHLCLTTEAMLPGLRDGIERARAAGDVVRRGAAMPRPYRLGLSGWLLVRGSGSGSRWRIKTAAPFEPAGGGGLAGLLERFWRGQDELLEVVVAAAGLPLDRVRMASPFNARVRYNLYAALALSVAHQERHLHQAEQAGAGA